MISQNLAQANGYSGASHEGINANASYHRMVYEDRKYIHSFDSFTSTIQELIQRFQSSNNSRLVARVLVEASYQEIQSAETFAFSMGGTIGYSGNAHELRSFLLGYTHQANLSKKVQDTYMNALFA